MPPPLAGTLEPWRIPPLSPAPARGASGKRVRRRLPGLAIPSPTQERGLRRCLGGGVCGSPPEPGSVLAMCPFAPVACPLVIISSACE